MPSEKEFLVRRLRIVEENLNKHKEYDIDEQGAFHFRFGPNPQREHALVREAHLLEKLISQVQEEKISRALELWSKSLAEKLGIHREYYRDAQEAYDAWLRLPFPTRIEIPEPPHPPDLEVSDVNGTTWVVDEKLLNVFDDIEERLQKWMASDD